MSAINAAFAAGTITEIRIAHGTYKPATVGNPGVPFHLVNNCSIRGGYAGIGAADPNARDIVAFETIWSGDLAGNDPTTTDNSNTVVSGTQPDSTVALQSAVLDGVTILGGVGGTFSNGGGVHNPTNAEPRYRNCSIRNNIASGSGGGMYCEGPNALLRVTNCTVKDNAAGDGAGIYLFTDSDPVIEGCTFEGNIATSYGGGLVAYDYCDPSVIDCRFISNEAGTAGGGVSCINSSPAFRRVMLEANEAGSGGGLYNDYGGDPTFVECQFLNNKALIYDGGGAYVHHGGRFYNTIWHANRCVNEFDQLTNRGGGVSCSKGQVFVNCKWTANGAADGGAIFSEYTAFSAVNCTIVSNEASGTAGGILVSHDDPLNPTSTLVNSIVWNNVDNTANTPSYGEGAQITDNGLIDVTYTDVMNCSTYCANPTVTFNTGDDPMFVNLADLDLHLSACSPLIDRGNTPVMPDDGTVVGGGPIDLDGDTVEGCSECTAGERIPDLDHSPRVIDDVGIADTGIEDGICQNVCHFYIDLGAYEWRDCGGDMNGDGLYNGLDIQPFAHCMVQGPDIANGCRCADMNHDNQLTVIGDMGCFIESLLNKTNACALNESCDPGPKYYLFDCNGNEVPDANDIALGTSLDCNKNGVPDECDLNSETSLDVNSDGAPDECEIDCDGNSMPDAWEIYLDSSKDINSNNILDICEPDCNGNELPDDYDIANGAADCNANGVPDSCEYDCNSNGVPDDCDINRDDPDGDTFVSEDCNENGIPDECDISRSIMPSFDCNDNGIPDECELSGNDSNENGILDECEKSQRGGNQPMMPGGEFDEAAAWELFYEWYEEQVSGDPGDWGTLSGSERFERLMDELYLLGLPLAPPW